MSGLQSALLSVLFFTFMGISFKALPSIPDYEIAFFRSALSCLVCCLLLKIKRITLLGHHPKKLILRGMSGTVALILFFRTLKTLPLPLAITLQYSSPLFIALLSILILKETASWLQILCLAFSFLSVLLTKDTLPQSLSTEMIYGILAAFFGAISCIVIRSLKNKEHPLVILFYFSAISSLILALPTLIHWHLPSPSEWALLLLLSTFASLGQYFLTLSYQSSPAIQAAQISYLNVVSAIFVGEWLWKEHLNPQQYVGLMGLLLCAMISQKNPKKPGVTTQFS